MSPQAAFDMEQQVARALAAMLKDHAALGIRLVEVPYSWPAGLHRLSGKFFYISFANGVPTLQEFVEYLFDCLVPYCLPRKKYEAILKSVNPMSDYPRIIRLGEDSKALFIKAKNQLDTGGEPGELILYTLLEWALSAPRIVSKMYLKTNSNMPVHGTDGIHIGYDEASDLMSVYFGESKIYKDFSEAASAAFKSIQDLITNSGQISREVEILNNLSDLETIPEPMRARVCDYIDPYSISPATLQKRVVHACFLGFEYAAYKRVLSKAPASVPGIFLSNYNKRVASACRVIERHYSHLLPITTNLHVFLLPFPSVDEFRAKFFEKLGVVP